MRWFGHGRRAQATVTAAPTLEGRPPLRAGAGLRPANSSAGYVVSVGGSPAFSDLDDAERLILDQRGPARVPEVRPPRTAADVITRVTVSCRR